MSEPCNRIRSNRISYFIVGTFAIRFAIGLTLATFFGISRPVVSTAQVPQFNAATTTTGDRFAQAAPAETLPAPVQGGNGRHRIGMQNPQSDNLIVERSNGRISVVVRDAPLSEVLSALADSESLNLVLAAPATERITVSLKNRTLPETLNALLAAAGFTWTINNDVIYVTSLNGGGTVAPEVQGRVLMRFELDYASAADVDLAVKGLLSPVGNSWISQSSLTDNRRTNDTITVEDLPAYLARIESFIAQADQPPRQVLIEVHVLQVDLSDEDRHGVNLQNVASVGNLTLDFNTVGFANGSAPQAFFLQASGPNLSGLIEALKTTTDAKTLASPRIMALNGQESRIQVGEQLGFRVTTTTETSTLESVEFLDVGVVLTVVPHISRDGRVLMRIRPEVSTGNVNPTTGLPEEETTEVQTDVLLGSGQGMVIGGLIQETDSVDANKYLGLGDARFFGPFFQRRREVKSRTEIIVALIPHVLPLPMALHQRNDYEVSRAREPLFHGPLCRTFRPDEPRLPDWKLNPVPLRQRSPFNCIDGQVRRLPPMSNDYPCQQKHFPCQPMSPETAHRPDQPRHASIPPRHSQPSLQRLPRTDNHPPSAYPGYQR